VRRAQITIDKERFRELSAEDKTWVVGQLRKASGLTTGDLAIDLGIWALILERESQVTEQD